MDNLNWRFEQDAERHSVIRHRVPPRFTAHWASGADALPAPSVPCWNDPGSGGADDRLCLFGFQWIDRRPDPGEFERLMRAAAAVIDAWIASRL